MFQLTELIVLEEREKYENLAEEKLRQPAREIDREKVTEISEDTKLLEDAIGFRISKNEGEHINESSKTKSIPTPKLLIKDHKKLTRD